MQNGVLYNGENSMGLVPEPFEDSLPDWFRFIRCGGLCPLMINQMAYAL